MKPQTIGDLSLLVVDDSRTMRDMVRAALLASGVGTVHEAADGVQALQVLAARRIHGVFCDIEMPVMDGLRFVRTVRGGRVVPEPTAGDGVVPGAGDIGGQPPGAAGREIILDAEVPIVMLTRMAERHYVEQAVSAGANQYLVKPIRPPALQRCLKLMLDAARDREREVLDYTCLDRPRFTHFVLKGRLSAGHDEVVRRIIGDVLRRGPDNGVLDLSGVRRVDEFGIGSLLMINGLGISRGKRLAVIACTPALERDLRYVHVDRLLPIFDSLARYAQSLSRPVISGIDLRQFA